MNGLNPIEFNNLNGLMEIYADNLNTLTINNLEIDQSLTLSGNITANNATITPTNISYCDATSSIQTQINNLSEQLYTTTGGGFYELLFETTLLTYSGTYSGYNFGLNLGKSYGYYIGTASNLYSIGIQVSTVPTVACTIYIFKNGVQLCPITLSVLQTSNVIYPTGYTFSKGDYITLKQTAGTCSSGAKISVGFSCGGIVGASGSSASLNLGNIVVNTLSAGSNATLSIVNSGTSLDNIWNMTFGLPIGATGEKGDTGATGSKGDNGIDANYSTVAAMIAANDVLITAAYVLYISSITTPISAALTALTTTVSDLTKRVVALETFTNQLDTNIKNLADDLDKLRTKITDISGNSYDLKNTVNAMKTKTDYITITNKIIKLN